MIAIVGSPSTSLDDIPVHKKVLMSKKEDCDLSSKLWLCFDCTPISSGPIFCIP